VRYEVAAASHLFCPQSDRPDMRWSRSSPAPAAAVACPRLRPRPARPGRKECG